MQRVTDVPAGEDVVVGSAGRDNWMSDSINRSTSQSIDQPVTQSINQSLNQWTSDLIPHSPEHFHRRPDHYVRKLESWLSFPVPPVQNLVHSQLHGILRLEDVLWVGLFGFPRQCLGRVERHASGKVCGHDPAQAGLDGAAIVVLDEGKRLDDDGSDAVAACTGRSLGQERVG